MGAGMIGEVMAMGDAPMNVDTTEDMVTNDDTPGAGVTDDVADSDTTALDATPGVLTAPACAYPTAEDINPDPAIVEVNLDAAPLAWDPGTGKTIDAYAYNGLVPGPLIRAHVGDTVRIHFTNHLPESTTIHWHGIRVPNDMDGIAHDGKLEVAAGGTFEYEFVVNDPGFFWYHPHLNTASQVERGLMAPLLVTGPNDPTVSCDLPVVLDDILLTAGGSLVSAAQTKGDARLGNRLLTNGTSAPLISLRPGTQVLLHLVNAANGRFFDLQTPGGKLTVVGTDGGPIPPVAMEHLVMGPGDRYTIYVDTAAIANKMMVLETRPFDLHQKGAMSMGLVDPLEGQTLPVLTIGVAGAPVDEPVPMFNTPAVEPIDAPETIAHAWVISDVMGMDGSTMLMTGSIDGKTWPNVPVVNFVRDVPVRLTIQNKGVMHHPFHIHGQRFQLVTVAGKAPAIPGAWEDTFDLPPKSTTVLVSRMDNPGMWMYHCHILEHAESGMMAELMVQ